MCLAREAGKEGANTTCPVLNYVQCLNTCGQCFIICPDGAGEGKTLGNKPWDAVHRMNPYRVGGRFDHGIGVDLD